MHITAQPSPLPRLRNDLYCVEWDVKLCYTKQTVYELLFHSVGIIGFQYRDRNLNDGYLQKATYRFYWLQLPWPTGTK